MKQSSFHVKHSAKTLKKKSKNEKKRVKNTEMNEPKYKKFIMFKTEFIDII